MSPIYRGFKPDTSDTQQIPRKWFRRAAEQGNEDAQEFLGSLYDEGWGIPEDDKEAVKWYRRAAEQGRKSAQVFLGLKYAYGNGVPEDYVQAYMWSLVSGLKPR